MSNFLAPTTPAWITASFMHPVTTAADGKRESECADDLNYAQGCVILRDLWLDMHTPAFWESLRWLME